MKRNRDRNAIVAVSFSGSSGHLAILRLGYERKHRRRGGADAEPGKSDGKLGELGLDMLDA